MRTFVVVLCLCLMIGFSEAWLWRHKKYGYEHHSTGKAIGKAVGKVVGKVAGVAGKAVKAAGKVVGGIAKAGKKLLGKIFGDTDRLVQKLKEMDNDKYEEFMRDLDHALQDEVSEDESAAILMQLDQEVKRDSSEMETEKEFDAFEELRKQIE